MKKNIFISYSARYSKTTEKQIKQLEKQILQKMLQDSRFVADVLTEHYYNSNLLKCKKILKLLVLNLIRAINNESNLIISLDKNTLSKNKVSLKLYSGILDKLYRMDLVEIHKGFFIGAENMGKRTRIEPKDRLKTLIIQHTVEYTEQIKATFHDTVEYADKVKVIFKAANSNKTYAKFFGINDAIFTVLLEQDTVTLVVDNRGRIKNILR